MGLCASKSQVVESAAGGAAQAAAQQSALAATEPPIKTPAAAELQVDGGSKAAAAEAAVLPSGEAPAAAAAAAAAGSPVPVADVAASIPAAPVAPAAPSQAYAVAGDDDLARRAVSAPPVAPSQLPPEEDEPGSLTEMPATANGAAIAPAVTAQQPTARASEPGLPCAASGYSNNLQGGQPVHSALSHGGGRAGFPPRSVKFAERPLAQQQLGGDVPADAAGRPPRISWGSDSTSTSKGGGLDQPLRPRSRIPGRSQSSLNPRGPGNSNEVNEAVLAKQADILRANKMGKLRQRRGGLDSSFAAMQEALATTEKPLAHVNTRAAGLKHIGFGPFKRENQDEFFIQVGEFGGLPSSNLFCVFDGHGTYGKDAALYSRQLLPRLLDVEMTKYFQRVNTDSDDGLKGAVEVLITEVFGETERSLSKFGVNLASSGTTASVAYQKGNRLWVASAGDSRAILCSRVRDQWRALPLTIDHRPRRDSERERIEAAGARVAPKRLPSGRTVGEPRMWLQNASGPGLLLSRSLGDLTAATVGCTSDPEVSFTTLRPGVDHVLVMATDGVWDVLTNEQVCDIVVESPDPHIACRRVLDAALYEWEERMSADNITVLVVEFDWGEEGSLSMNSMEGQALTSSSSNRVEEIATPDVAGGLSAAVAPDMP